MCEKTVLTTTVVLSLDAKGEVKATRYATTPGRDPMAAFSVDKT